MSRLYELLLLELRLCAPEQGSGCKNFGCVHLNRVQVARTSAALALALALALVLACTNEVRATKLKGYVLEEGYRSTKLTN